MKIGFIGAGNMATAIIKGYLPNTSDDILVYDICTEKAAALEKLGVTAQSSINALAEQVNYLFLAVKPQNFTDVLTALKGHLSEDVVVVSIAAGITAEYIKNALGFDAKVVRVMPNTPLLLGAGASALAKVAPTTDEEFAFVCNIFKSSGEIAVIDADKMNEIISVNGSTPAYIYEFTKYFVNYAAKQGIDSETALRLFAQTLIGSAKMMTDSGYSLDELIEMVSSKGGTTIAGLSALRAGNMEAAVNNACDACTKRAYELAK